MKTHAKSNLTFKNVAIFAGAVVAYFGFLFYLETNLRKPLPDPLEPYAEFLEEMNDE